ncbi:hypothetical protein OG455_41890 [Kitasatospora sp. NBC_01287]|uniref:hypothetical protein n=1 Tax=Kitasatospora sp. NBC_01287 TaxID=2903573 RepID=UPI002255576F|nr:hypothetical protein [Kitasatospora sp. NBC_01287]MCX4751711.1 hypothetical protein [Kitasatospora sp. NBC_01287]MCX4751997.1 hypothetical protein [Kitasatospora sp. NBC_01287]
MDKPTDLRPTITVGTLNDLNDLYLTNLRTHRGLAVGSRDEVRDGQRFGLGGLRWRLVTTSAVYETFTGEDEVLPDLPVARDGWPFAISDGESAVAA